MTTKKIIVLTGLVSVEKVQLTSELASTFAETQRVTVIDNMTRLAVDDDTLPDTISLVQHKGDDMRTLHDVILQNQNDILIAAVSEQAHPEKLFVQIERLRDQLPHTDIYALAMIDTRTCDCFPNVRSALEMYADATLMMPYSLEEVIAFVTISS